MKRFFSLLLATSLVSCATKDLERCPPGTPGIILSEPVECQHKDGKFTLHYDPETKGAKPGKYKVEDYYDAQRAVLDAGLGSGARSRRVRLTWYTSPAAISSRMVS